MRSQQIRWVLIWQFIVLFLFFLLTITNEVFDLPHFLFHDAATTWHQRTGEIWIELIMFSLVMGIELFFFRRMIQHIRVLEGFLPICANCKKIRIRDQWEQIETYFSSHSKVQFSHSICPECKEKLYPELFSTASGQTCRQ